MFVSNVTFLDIPNIFWIHHINLVLGYENTHTHIYTYTLFTYGDAVLSQSQTCKEQLYFWKIKSRIGGSPKIYYHMEGSS